MISPPTASIAVLVLLLSACGNSSPPAVSDGSTRVLPPAMAARPAAQCALRSPLLGIGTGRDTPGRPAPARDNAAPNARTSLGSTCPGNTRFAVGSGIADITGNAGGSITVGYENLQHQTQGIHTRLYARAFAVLSPCNGKRALIAVVDSGFITQAVRQGVLQRIAADPEMRDLYGADNVLLSATHTHSAPGGDSHDVNQNLFRLGYDDLGYAVYVQGIFEALRSAQRNLHNHPGPARIGLAQGELLDVNMNRSPEAYALNPAEERADWLDLAGREVDVNKRMTLIRFVRNDGTELGLLNWFGVHTTSLGIHVPAIGSDNKGYAALGIERIMKTRYGLKNGENTFVAAFAQEDEGDSSPNLCMREHPFPDPRIGCGRDSLESNAASGSKQLAKALQLYDQAQMPLRGGVEYRLFHVDMNQVTVSDPDILARLRHPQELDTPVKRTCSAGLGVSFAAGAEDNRGRPATTVEGVTCANRDLVDQVTRDVQTAFAGLFGAYANVPPFLLSNALCAANAVPHPGDYSCQAEKPVLFPATVAPLPLQIITLGNLAIVGLPWEVTTSSARRLRALVLDSLGGNRIDTVIIAGLSNDFAQYMTTREEYSAQQYEGASTLFGPWQLAAAMQELRKLALSLRDGTATPEGSPAPQTMPGLFRHPPFLIADLPLPSGRFGSVLQDTRPMYLRGEIARAGFQGGHPRNDTLEKLEKSYAYVERQRPDGGWEIIAEDRDPELQFRWFPTPVPLAPTATESEVAWTIPGNAPAGRYRLRHNGTARAAGILPAQAYEAVSTPFEILGPPGECADELPTPPPV